MRKKLVILTISLCALLLILNNYVIAQPTQKQLEVFRSAKTVRVLVNQSYGDAKDVSLPFKDVTKRLLGYAGIRIASADSKTYDITIKIQAQGQVKGTYYLNQYHYSGASLSGSISFISQDCPPYKKAFSVDIYPPTIITSKYPTPSSAPFKGAFYESGSFLSKFIEMIGVVYGKNCIVMASLSDKDWRLRSNAAEILGSKRDPEIIKPMIEALNDKKSLVRRNAAEAMGDIDDPMVIEALIVALRDIDYDVRRLASDSLAKIGKSTVEPLIVAMKNKNYKIQEGAIEALERMPMFAGIRDRRAVMPLIDKLKDTNPYIRKLAARALGSVGGSGSLYETGDPRAVEPLISALQDENSDVREAAAQALGPTGDPHAVEPLISALKDEDHFVRVRAAQALRGIKARLTSSSNGFGEDYLKWQKWWEENKEKLLKKK